MTIKASGSSYDSTTSFTYNPASQIASSTRTNDAYAWTGHVNVDRSYTANGLNQYTAVAGIGFGYDTNGNLTSDGSNTFVYDVENRLVTRSGGASATLRYDPLGRLYEVTGSSGTRRFLYDGSDLVAEYNTAGALLRRYVHGLGAGDDPLVWYDGSGLSDRRYLYADERGSIVAVTNGAGSALAINKYDEYGIPAAGNLGAFQYTGQVWLPELGMYYYKARMYSPTLGRFMQADPIGYGDGMNMYAYVGGDPVNWVDPTGLEGWYQKGNQLCHDWSVGVGEEAGPQRTTCFGGFGGSGADGGGGAGLPGFPIGLPDLGTMCANQSTWSYAVPGLPFICGLTSPNQASSNQDSSPAETPQNDTTYLAGLCSRSQKQLRAAGEFAVDAGGAVVAGGAVITGGSAVLAVGGAVTGNVPAAGVGTIGMAAGGAVTAFGGKTMLVGSIAAFAGGSSTQDLVRDGSDAIINRLPVSGIIRAGIKKATDGIASAVPDIRICR